MTTGNYSNSPADALRDALAKGYSGLRVERGVPLLDRDLNLLGDLLAAALQRGLRTHVGDGCAGATDFAIESNGDPLDFRIRAGSFLAAGAMVSLPADSSYKTQPIPPGAAPAPALTAPQPGQPNPRADLVYLDVWSDEIDETRDPGLGNALDVGRRTSLRVLTQFVVRVAENAGLPAAPAGHAFAPLARISRAAGGAAPVFSDLRLSRLSLGGAVTRLGKIEAALSPRIDAVAPNEVLPGQSGSIAITGRNLDLGFAKVMLGPVAGIVNPGTKSDLLTVAVPATAQPGNWDLTVETLIGIATAPVQIRIDRPPPQPTFAPSGGALPQISPAHATPGTLLTLNGSNFTGVTQVIFNANPAAIAQLGGDLVSVADAVIQVKVPLSLAASVGVAMSLTATVDGTPARSGTSDLGFRVDPQPIPRPVWGAPGGQITPNKASKGQQVTLSGQNFGTMATTTVKFEGTTTVTAAASDMVSVTATTIVVKVPQALSVPAAPNNKCNLIVAVQGAADSLESNDLLTVI
jgi:hypothetical protein